MTTTSAAASRGEREPIPFRRGNWALALAVAVSFALSLALLLASLRANQGHFIYPLDDAYIHMAFSKHWACDGVLGITRYENTPATSSPLWSASLAALFYVGGVHEWTLFVLNNLCALGLLFLCTGLLRKHLASEVAVLVGLLGCVFLMPLLPAIFSGMEHILHAVLALALCYAASRLLAAPAAEATRWQMVALGLLGSLAVATRYESLFVVAAVGGFLLLRRRWVLACGFVGTAILPAVLMGIYSVQHGGYWLPNSLMTKAAFPHFDSWGNIYFALGGRALAKIVWVDQHLLGLFLLVAGLLIWRWYRNRSLALPDWMGLIYLPVLLLHCQFAQTGWFFRYESYLMVLGLMTAGLLGSDLQFAASGKRVLVALLVALCLFPGVQRGWTALWQTVPAMRNVYQQHYQMAQFLKVHYDKETVVLNDVGAITFLTDARCLDIGGLINMEIVRLMHQHAWTPGRLRELVAERKARIAIVYPELLPGPMPDWIPVATWRIRGNVVCAYDTVYLCALHAAEVPYLQKALRLFAITQRVPVQETWATDVTGTPGKPH